ncbi:hypothetical protein MPTK1_3g13360 [Marchantia polymorpha subsp. ruderalis]|uniref:ADP-ribosylhydrolase ARH3 n=4 Tax=Marchantia polymorpha TaxID=3197 RepID=A0AAF6B0D9_MARPO|nr:hypothetical protein MARPO_0050s0128 [Marchantia polymorpha]BBN05473.1 hypothetical protein Mp_3g13360 [Marchantia polymorpha subsp. ruderalis]|eukprot:PTQ38686.1 hypothetical protein MARPO_0050s0128 [Marchantia polymorpha]
MTLLSRSTVKLGKFCADPLQPPRGFREFTVSELKRRGAPDDRYFFAGSRVWPKLSRSGSKCSRTSSRVLPRPHQSLSRNCRMETFSAQDRFAGCLVGGACGDALGCVVEELQRAQIVAKYGELGVREFEKIYDYPGEFTDDTQMTLFTAEGLLSTILCKLKDDESLANFRAEDAVPALHQSYLRWLASQNEESQSPLFKEVRNLGMLMTQDKLQRRRGPGQTCRMSIKSGAVGSSKNKINDSKGCGGIMRVAPCGLIVHSAFASLTSEEKAELAFKLGNVAAAITHTHPSGWLPSGCQAAIISWILSGESLEEAIARTVPLLEKEPHNEETMTKILLARELSREFLETFSKGGGEDSALEKQMLVLRHIEALGHGFVGEEALGITLYCALVCGEDVETGICYSVNHSGDSDSTGAMVGNILGALFGEAAIPSKWKDNVLLGDLIREMSDDLFRVRDPDSRQELTAKYPPPIVTHKGEDYYSNEANLVTPPFKMPPGSIFFDWANSV